MDLIRTQDRAFPPQFTSRRTSQVVAESPHCATEFTTPFPVIEAEAVDHNLRTMAGWCAEHGLELHPHIKSTMAPQLFLRQLEAGASGLTVATPAQLRYAAESGARTIQLAGELVQPPEARWLARWLSSDPGRTVLVWVDSPQAVEVVGAAAAAEGLVIDVLVEVGAAGGRCGIRTDAQRRDVLDTALASSGVRPVGVAGYEGAIAGRRDEAGLAAVRAFFGSLAEVLETSVAEGSIAAEHATVSAGGSMFTDLVVEAFSGRVPRVILRSGCYLLHDDGLYAANASFGPDAQLPASRALALRPALTVWTSVVSRPEDGLAILDAGRRDLSFDQGLPAPVEVLHRDGAPGQVAGAVTAVNDQHAFLRIPETHPLAVGDRVRLGISHPCTTMDKWSRLPVVDASGHLVDVVTTWF